MEILNFMKNYVYFLEVMLFSFVESKLDSFSTTVQSRQTFQETSFSPFLSWSKESFHAFTLYLYSFTHKDDDTATLCYMSKTFWVLVDNVVTLLRLCDANISRSSSLFVPPPPCLSLGLKTEEGNAVCVWMKLKLEAEWHCSGTGKSSQLPACVCVCVCT